MLDAVRAARKLEPRLSKRFVIAGHSQGGHAALFAASLAPSWTPELRAARHRRLRARLAPRRAVPAHDADRARRAAASAASSRSACAAIDTAGLGVDVPALLTPEATALYPQTETECLDVLGGASSCGGLPLNQIFRSGADLGPLVAAIDTQRSRER